MAALLLLLLQLLACCRRDSAASPVRLQPSPLRVSCPGPHGQVSQRQDNEHRVSCLWESTVTLHYQPAPGAGPEVEGEEGQPPSPPCCLWYLNSASVRNISRWSGQVVLQTGQAPSLGASRLLTVQCSSSSCAAPECFHHNVSVEILGQDMRLFVLWPQTHFIRMWQKVELGWCARLMSASWQYRFSSEGGVPSTLLLPSSEYQDTPSPAIYPTVELQHTCATYYSYRVTVYYGHPGIHIALVRIEQMPHVNLSLSLKVEPDLLHVLSISSKLLSVLQQPLSLSWWLQPLTLSTLAYRLVDTQAAGSWLRSYSSFTLPSNFCAISTPQSLDEIVVASIYFHVDGKRFEKLMGEVHLLNGTLSLTAGKEIPIHVNLSPEKTNRSMYIFRYNQGTFHTSKENNTISTDHPNTCTVFYQYKELSYLLTIEFVALQWYKFNMYLYMNQKRALIRSLAERDLDIHIFSSGRLSLLQNFSYLVWFIPAQHPLLQCKWTFYLQLFDTQKDHIVQSSTYTYNNHVKNARRFVRRSALPFDAEKYTGFVAKVNCTSSAPTPALLSFRINNHTAKTVETPVVCERRDCKIRRCWIQRPGRRTNILYKKKALSFFLFVRLDTECHIGISIKPLWKVYRVKDTRTEPDWSNPIDSSALYGTDMIHLTVPSDTLDYGLYLFYFSVEVVPIMTSTVLTAHDYIYVQIERADLVANISGGPVRTVDFAESWTLDGSESADPDPQAGPLTFTWYCTRDFADYKTMKFTPRNRCHPLQKDLRWIKHSGPVQTIPAESLPGSTLYYFRLVIQKGHRMSHADQIVEVNPGPPLILDVKCLENCGTSVIPTERFAISGKCSNCKPKSKPLYYWSLYSDTSKEINFDWDSKTSTGRTGAYVSINALTFTKPTYRPYALHLRVTTWDGRTTSDRKPFMINNAPRRGRCYIRPRRGIAFETKFVVKCRGFSDNHLPLTYKVILASRVPHTTSITSVVQNTFGTILYFGSQPKTPPSFLPIGGSSRRPRRTLKLYVQVRDAFGSFTQVDLRVYVRKPHKTQSLSVVFHELLASASHLTASTSGLTGDRLRAGYLVYLAASLLNYIRDTPSPQLPQAKLREAVVKGAVNISANSIMEVNQVVAVLTEVTEAVDKMNVRSLDLAIGKLAEVTGNLKVQRSKTHWSEEAEIQTSGIVRCLSNVLRADLLSYNNASANAIPHVFSIMDSVTDIIFRGKVPEEMETLIETGRWNITLKKNEAWNITQIPATDDCQNCFYPTPKKADGSELTQDTVFSTALVEFDETPFPWLDYTPDIISMVLGFKVAETRPDGELVPIMPDRSDAFLIRKGGLTTIHLVMGPDKTEAYTTGGFSLEIDKPSTNLYFQIITNLKAAIKVLIFVGTNLTHTQPVASFTAFHDMPTVAKGNEDAMADCSSMGPYVVCLPNTLLTKIVQEAGGGTQNISIILETRYVLRYPNRKLLGIYIFNDQCLFLDGPASQWSKDKCVVGPLTDWEKIHCICLSSLRKRSLPVPSPSNIRFLAVKVVVLPNTVDLGRNLIADIPKNPLTLITVLCIFAIYLLLCCWAIRRDRLEKEIKYIVVLPDNEASDQGIFLVTLYTGSRFNAGTKAEVFLQLIGQHGRSKFRCLWHQPSPAFQRGGIDCFLVTTKKNLGDIRSFKVRLNNEGKSPTWFLSRAEVEDMSTRKVWFFMCRRWIFLDKNKPLRDWKFSPIDTETPLQKYDYFLINFNRRLTEYHLWLSIFAPVIAGAFTRFQRLSTFLAVILFTLLVNIMFFNAEKSEEAPIYLRHLRSIAVGIECALLTLPVEMLIIALFKYSQKDPPPVVTKMYPKVDSRYWNNCIVREEDANVIETEEETVTVNSPRSGKRSQKLDSGLEGSFLVSKGKILITTIRQLFKIRDTEPPLCWWCFCVAWGLVLVITVLSSFFIVLYGLSYGYQTSREWLIASGTSILQNIFFNSILKSLLFSALSAMRPKYSEDIRWVTQEKHVEINKAEETRWDS